jgi:hypothetical protein
VTVVAKLHCAHTLAQQRTGSGDQHEGHTEFRRDLSLLHDVQSIRRHSVRGIKDKNIEGACMCATIMKSQHDMRQIQVDCLVVVLSWF